MADVNVNALTQVTAPESVDSIVMVDRTTNEGRIIPANTFTNLLGVVKVTLNSGNTFSTLPQTVSGDPRITSDMVVVHYEMSNPAAMGSNWRVDTSAGQVAVGTGGTISGSTSMVVYLAKSRT